MRLDIAGEISITLADRREVSAPIALAYVKVLDRESIVPVVIIEIPKPLLGVSVLKCLGLRVDPSLATSNIRAPLAPHCCGSLGALPNHDVKSIRFP